MKCFFKATCQPLGGLDQGGFTVYTTTNAFDMPKIFYCHKIVISMLRKDTGCVSTFRTYVQVYLEIYLLSSCFLRFMIDFLSIEKG